MDTIEVSDLYTLAGAAREVGLKRQSIQRAVTAGRIENVYYTADGLPLVLMEDVQFYLDNPLPKGPKPKAKRRRKR